MRCPNAVKADTLRCISFNGAYTPSGFQMAEYCQCRAYIKCPIFLGYHIAMTGQTDRCGSCGSC